MIPLVFDYASPSAFQSDRDRATLGLSADQHRPVRFHGRVKEQLLTLRLALQTLGSVVWSNDMWLSGDSFAFFTLDPVITVHPDRIFFEAFSQDQSVYGVVIADRNLFETTGAVSCGTTNVDFTSWLWAALGEMRSSRQTWLRIEAAGFEVSTTWGGGRFENKVELPDSWVRGFLQLQAAMTLPGTRVRCRPVDVLAALRFLQMTKAKVAPRAVRYEFEPQQPARLVLEPWEQVFPLKGTEHNYQELRVIRTWGRRRLQLLEPLLPFADSVTVYLKGRALPSFYAVRLGGITFLLGLSGWSDQKWTGTGSFDLLFDETEPAPAVMNNALDLLRQRYVMTQDEATGLLGIGKHEAARVLTRLCRQGRAIYDIEARAFRHRELFDRPVDEARLFPPEPRREQARAWVAKGQTQVQVCSPRETRKTRRLKTPERTVYREVIYREWQVSGAVADQAQVEIVINDSGQVIFGTCGCTFFKENLLNQGPCGHMIALQRGSENLRQDLPTSQDAPGPPTSSGVTRNPRTGGITYHT